MELIREVVESFIRLMKAEISPNTVLVASDDCVRSAEGSQRDPARSDSGGRCRSKNTGTHHLQESGLSHL